MRSLLLLVIPSMLFVVGCDRDRDRKAAASAGRAKWSAAGKMWVDQMVAMVPGEFCKPGSFFTTCFKQSGEDCRKLATTLMNGCLDKNPQVVPTEVNAQTGAAAGRDLGTCAGGELETELRRQGKFTNAEHCDDVAYWTRAAQ